MANVILKSGLFGDRTVRVNISNEVNRSVRTGTGTGRAVTLTKMDSNSYRVSYDNGPRKVPTVEFHTRKEAMKKAAEFIIKYEPIL